jgi:hypothetical protein
MRSRTRTREKTLYQRIVPLFDPLQLIGAFPRYVGFLKDLMQYSKLDGAEQIKMANTFS